MISLWNKKQNNIHERIYNYDYGKQIASGMFLALRGETQIHTIR